MLFLKPSGRIDLDHRAYFLRGTSSRSILFAAAEDGQLTIFTSELKFAQKLSLSGAVQAISPHSSGHHLAWVDKQTGCLTIQKCDGTRILEIACPQVKEQPGFDDCFFDEDERYLWTTTLLNSGNVVVQLHEAETGTCIASATAKDPFGGSSCSFHQTGKPMLSTLWLAAGSPDMTQGYWLERTSNGITCTLDPCLTATIPPVFSPDGKRFLVLNDECAIRQHEYPSMAHIGSPLTTLGEDDPFRESLCYLNDRQVLASTNEGRLFAVDAVRMKVEDEVALEGHEPKPIGHYYPSLAREVGLATDISGFERFGNVIIFAYRRDRGIGLEEWKDSLIWLSVEDRAD